MNSLLGKSVIWVGLTFLAVIPVATDDLNADTRISLKLPFPHYVSNVVPDSNDSAPPIYWIDDEHLLFSGFLGPKPQTVVDATRLDRGARHIYVWN